MSVDVPLHSDALNGYRQEDLIAALFAAPLITMRRKECTPTLNTLSCPLFI